MFAAACSERLVVTNNAGSILPSHVDGDAIRQIGAGWDQDGEPQIAPAAVEELSASDRESLMALLRQLTILREAPISRRRKAMRAVHAARDHAHAVVSLVAVVGRHAYTRLWSNGSWASRLALGGSAAAVVAAHGNSAGLAFFGTAVAVPLWIVIGSGGAFAGALLDALVEVTRSDRAAAERRYHTGRDWGEQ